jgi:hypothetical protein
MFFDKLKKKSETDSFPAPLGAETHIGSDLPDDLERFRIRPPGQDLPSRQMQSPVRQMEPAPMNEEPMHEDFPSMPFSKSSYSFMAEKTSVNKVDLIIQKLETIDARLRFMEEKMKNY